jgi:hypothetical protein
VVGVGAGLVRQCLGFRVCVHLPVCVCVSCVLSLACARARDLSLCRRGCDSSCLYASVCLGVWVSGCLVTVYVTHYIFSPSVSLSLCVCRGDSGQGSDTAGGQNEV